MARSRNHTLSRTLIGVLGLSIAVAVVGYVMGPDETEARDVAVDENATSAPQQQTAVAAQDTPAAPPRPALPADALVTSTPSLGGVNPGIATAQATTPRTTTP